MKSNIGTKVENSTKLMSLLGLAGFIGIVWLMIFGFMSGNLGFTQDSQTTSVQALTLANNSIVTFTGTTGKVNPTVSNVVVINATGGETITSGNYTLTSTTITGSATMTLAYNGTGVNVSYITRFDSDGQISTETLIDNMTSGYTVFFGFAPTWFQIVAIILLIVMLVGLLGVVVGIMKTRKGSSDYT